MTQSNTVQDIYNDLVIVTSTWYPNDKDMDLETRAVSELRAKLSTKTFQKASNLGIQTIVVDAGSNNKYLANFRDVGADVYSQAEEGMGAGRRQAIQLAVETGKKVIAWIEPEKVDYIDHLVLTAEPIYKGDADIVVPQRMSLESYPISQIHAERYGNSVWEETTGRDFDVWFGPRTFNRESAHFFLDYEDEYGGKWDSIFIPVLDAIVAGSRVESVNVDYTHPFEQTQFEQGNVIYSAKRLNQLNNLIPAITTHWKSHLTE